MNFFEHQEQAKKKTIWMVGMFSLALLATLTIIHMVLDFMVGRIFGYSVAWVWGFDVLAVFGTLSMVVSKLHQLRDPARMFAKDMGAFEVQNDGVLEHTRFKNIVEEMAIASSIPRPQIFIIPNDLSINAFALGHNPSSSAIFVTDGTLKYLNRDELQGVIGHEFSHILNGDMKSNIIMVAVLEGLEGVFNFAWESMTQDHEDEEDEFGVSVARGFFSNRASYIVLLAFIVMVIGSIGMFFSRLIKAGISRQREYLADASSVQFTRQTQGIAGALQKIAIMENEGLVGSPTISPEVSHMMFSRIFDAGWFSADTHPPLRERIQRLDPSYNNNALDRFQRRLSRVPNPEGLRFNGHQEDIVKGFATATPVAPTVSSRPVTSSPDATNPAGFHLSRGFGLSGQEASLSSDSLVLKVGSPSDHNAQLATYIRSLIPEDLSKPQTPQKTLCLLYALTMDQTPATYQRQLNILGDETSSDEKHQAALFYVKTQALPNFVKTALLWLHLPALRGLPSQKLEHFSTTIQKLTEQDNYVSLYENALRLSIQAFIRDVVNPTRRTSGRWSVDDGSYHIERLLWFMAQQNTDSQMYSFHAGWKKVFGRPRLDTPEYTVVPSSIQQILTQLTSLSPLAKEKLVSGLETIVTFDNQLTASEIAFLRACCFTLNCPLPPLYIDIA